VNIPLKYLFIAMLTLPIVTCSPSPKVQSDPERVYWADITPKTSPEVTNELLSNGKNLYNNNCTKCHGVTGRGDEITLETIIVPPRDFALGQFKLRSTNAFPTDYDLFRTITVGFPQYDMPEFGHLSQEERWSLVHYVKKLIKSAAPQLSQEPRKSVKIPNPKPYTQASIDLGKIHFNKMGCAYCHGSNGIANTAITLKDAQGNLIKPRNFQDGPEYFKGGGRPEDIVRILMTGMAGTPMQPYGIIGADNQELWDIAHYVHSLANTPKKETK